MLHMLAGIIAFGGICFGMIGLIGGIVYVLTGIGTKEASIQNEHIVTGMLCNAISCLMFVPMYFWLKP